MGFDLYGQCPKAKNGEYFRNNCWWWRPLAEYVLDNYAVSSPNEWGYNNGAEVSAEEAVGIADKLEALLKSGDVAKYSRAYKAKLAKLPLVKCEYCRGSGVRKDMTTENGCNGCDGRGEREDWECNYPFYVANVREFALFCRNSGGFTIC